MNDERNIIKKESTELNQIYWLLENSTCSTEQISNYFKVGRKTIERINNGKTHFCQEKDYPIRKKRRRSIESIEQALNKGGIL
jgi:ribonuclease I